MTLTWPGQRRILAAALLLVVSTPSARGIEQSPQAGKLSREWKAVTTPSLTVMGNARESDLRQVGLQIEHFRGALRSMFRGLRLDPPVPTIVVVFRDDGAFAQFKPRVRGKVNQNVAGYFIARPHVNYIAMTPSVGRDFTFRIIFHEYTHHLVHLNFKRLPLWLNEGLAEFYSTFSGSERDARTIVGRPIDAHVAMLVRRSPMPVAKFVRPETPGELHRDVIGTQLFYAQSWALTHFLLIGNNGARKPQLGRFISALERGAAMDTAFVDVFGPDLSVLDRELRSHVSKFRLDAIQLQPEVVPLNLAATRVSEVDAQHVQGDILVSMGAPDLAEGHLSQALALDPTHRGVRLSLAMLRLQQERFAEALDVLRTPELDASRQSAVSFVRAEALRESEQHVEAAAAYQRAISLDPNAAYAYYGLSLSQLATGDKAAAGSFARCLSLSPDPQWYRSRVNAAMRLGIDEHVIADARNYLQAVGWNGDDGTYVMLPAVIVLLRRSQQDAAREALLEVEQHVRGDSWQAALVAFFRGQLSADALIARAGRDDGWLTEAHAYVGILASIAGERAKAVQHLEWVMKSGRKDFIEYGFAIGELRRLERAALKLENSAVEMQQVEPAVSGLKAKVPVGKWPRSSVFTVVPWPVGTHVHIRSTAAPQSHWRSL